MSHVAWSACLCACVLVTLTYRAKTAEQIEMPFGVWRFWQTDSCGSKEPHILNGVNIGRILSQSWGVTRRRCGLLPNYFRHLLNYFHRHTQQRNLSLNPPQLTSVATLPCEIFPLFWRTVAYDQLFLPVAMADINNTGDSDAWCTPKSHIACASMSPVQ